MVEKISKEPYLCRIHSHGLVFNTVLSGFYERDFDYPTEQNAQLSIECWPDRINVKARIRVNGIDFTSVAREGLIPKHFKHVIKRLTQEIRLHIESFYK